METLLFLGIVAVLIVIWCDLRKGIECIATGLMAIAEQLEEDKD